MSKQPSYVYITTNKLNTVLYTGVTDNLIRRIYQHKNHLEGGFTDKYNVTKLVYYEIFDNLMAAFNREKQIKNWRRQWKIELINNFNPDWKDLYDDIIE